MLKKQCIALLVALAISALTVGVALAQDILVINGTSFQLHALALSDNNSNSWGNDLLGDSILYPGEGIEINLAGSPVGWDMAVVDEEGEQLEFHDLNLTGVSRVTLFSDGTATFE